MSRVPNPPSSATPPLSLPRLLFMPLPRPGVRLHKRVFLHAAGRSFGDASSFFAGATSLRRVSAGPWSVQGASVRAGANLGTTATSHFLRSHLVDPGTQHPRSTFGGCVCFGGHALVGCWLALGTGVRAGADLGTTAAPRCLCLGLLRRRWHPALALYVRQTRLLRRARPHGVPAGSRNGRASWS